MKSDNLYYMVVAVLVIVFVALGPIIAIWSLNTLFPALAIPYTFWTWLAAFLLLGVARGQTEVIKK